MIQLHPCRSLRAHTHARAHLHGNQQWDRMVTFPVSHIWWEALAAPLTNIVRLVSDPQPADCGFRKPDLKELMDNQYSIVCCHLSPDSRCLCDYVFFFFFPEQYLDIIFFFTASNAVVQLSFYLSSLCITQPNLWLTTGGEAINIPVTIYYPPS